MKREIKDAQHPLSLLFLLKGVALHMAAGKLERDFQSKLIKEIGHRFPGAIVTKLDSGHIQGIPDLLVLYWDKWAALEVKRSERENRQPNQEYYVDQMNNMSFSRFIYPENKEEVLNELQQAFEPDRRTRISKRK